MPEDGPKSDVQATQRERGTRFWDDYYSQKEETANEWICHPEDIVPLVLACNIPHPLRMLEIGCGDSMLSEIIHDSFLESSDAAENEAVERIVAVDISPVAISVLKTRCSDTGRDKIVPIVGDCTSLPRDICPDNFFNLVLDKGTSDTLSFRARSKDAWYLLNLLFAEVYRVLAPGGVYMIITPRPRIFKLRGSAPWAKIEKERLETAETAHVVIKGHHHMGSNQDEIEQKRKASTMWCFKCYKAASS